jgi:hypothetical protein
MSEAHRATKAVVCAGHLLMLQNPKALIKTNKDWVEYYKLVCNWCDNCYVKTEDGWERIFWHNGYSVEQPAHNEDDETVRKPN